MSTVQRLPFNWERVSTDRVVTAVIGLWLLVAAGLKVLAPSGAAASEAFSPALQLLAVQAEVLTGTWLLTGRCRVTAWLTAVALFAVLTAISLSSACAGRSDCGCFGRVQVNPWYTSGLNIVCLTLLLVARPSLLLTNWKQSSLVVTSLVVLTAAVAAAASRPAGEAWLARLRGDTIVMTPSVHDLGEGASGAVRRVQVTVTNQTDGDVRIIGGSVSCDCVTTDGLPLTIPPYGKAVVEVTVTFKGTPGRFSQKYTLFTDQARRPVLKGQIIGTVSQIDP